MRRVDGARRGLLCWDGIGEEDAKLLTYLDHLFQVVSLPLATPNQSLKSQKNRVSQLMTTQYTPNSGKCNVMKSDEEGKLTLWYFSTTTCR